MSTKSINEISSRIDYELKTFDLYINYVESSLETLKTLVNHEEKNEKSMESMLRNLGSRNIENQILPKYFLNSLIITIYAIFEKAIKELAEYYRSKKNIELKLNDIRGSFLDQSLKYFNNVLHVNFCDDKNVFKKLETVALLRNIFAHCNSSFSAIKKSEDKKNVKNLIEKNIGIKQIDDDILISKSYLYDSVDLLKHQINYVLNKITNLSKHP
ncbi:MAG: hypothetical protein KAR38_04820 [Calditrichia bacterium]|nr:hypothetical protein [Calditrichia bacterium]